MTEAKRAIPRWLKIGGGAVLLGGATWGGLKLAKAKGWLGHEHLPGPIATPPLPAGSPAPHVLAVPLVIVHRDHPRAPGVEYVTLEGGGHYRVTWRVRPDGVTADRVHMVAVAPHGHALPPMAHHHASPPPHPPAHAATGGGAAPSQPPAGIARHAAPLPSPALDAAKLLAPAAPFVGAAEQAMKALSFPVPGTTTPPGLPAPADVLGTARKVLGGGGGGAPASPLDDVLGGLGKPGGTSAWETVPGPGEAPDPTPEAPELPALPPGSPVIPGGAPEDEEAGA